MRKYQERIILFAWFLFPWASYQIRKIAGCACAGSRTFPRHRRLAIPICITARAWRTCRDAFRDHKVGGAENSPGIPGACAARCFTYLVKGPWSCIIIIVNSKSREKSYYFNKMMDVSHLDNLHPETLNIVIVVESVKTTSIKMRVLKYYI